MPPSSEAQASQSFYADAGVYDLLHAKGTAAEVDALEKVRSRYITKAPNVWLEPACGSGRVLRIAAKRSASRRVIGFDREEGMVRYAEHRAKLAGLAKRHTLFVAEMTDFAGRIKPGSVGFAFNLINTIRHLESDRELLAHFDQMARVLSPGSVYVVGLTLSMYACEMPSEDVWIGKRGRVSVKQVVNFIPPDDAAGERMELVYSHMTVTTPKGEREINSSYRLRTYSLKQWQSVIGRSALRIAGFADMLGEKASPVEPGYGLWALTPR